MNGWMWNLRKYASGQARNAFSKVSKGVARIIYNKLQNTLGFYVPIGLECDSDPYFPHGMSGVFITSHCRIGSDLTILQQVTIGSNTLIDSAGLGAPTIGDRCYIGAGAKIIGAVKIGDNVRIGANAVVTKDVPDNATVVGFNRVILSDAPRINRHIRRTANGWVYSDAYGSYEASADDKANLQKAFGHKHRIN
jgi:serine O-acetyltransferase